MRAAMQRAMYQRSPMQKAIDRIGAPLWTPARLFAASEQGVWYDPSDFSTMFQDSAGSTPVTAVGQPVGKMLDKSGRGNHATQATTASKPILQQDGNGKYYLAFDGVDDALFNTSVTIASTQKVSVFFGIEISTTAVGSIYSYGNNSLADAGAFGHFSSEPGAGSLLAAAYTSVQNAGYTSGSTTPRRLVAATSFDTTASSQMAQLATRINTAPQTLTLYTGGSLASGNLGGTLPLHVGRRNGGPNFNGRIYQLIIRGALTDAAGIAAAEAFVNSKTGAY